MAFNGVLTPQNSNHPVLNFFNSPSPQTFKLTPVHKLFAPLFDLKQTIKLMHKPLIQHNCQQQQKKKKKKKSEEKHKH